MSDLAKLLGPMARRVGNLVARGKVLAANSASKMQTLQVALLAGETKDTVEHFEPFGFTSKPLAGAEHVTLFLDGDRSHGVTVVVADRRYRLQGLEDGEAALHDAFGNKVHLKKDGTLAIVASAKVQITSPLVTISGNLQVAGFITAGGDVVGGGKSLVGHTHPNGTPNTGAPN
jgi:phage baseplate assembly protein V